MQLENVELQNRGLTNFGFLENYRNGTFKDGMKLGEWFEEIGRNSNR